MKRASVLPKSPLFYVLCVMLVIILIIQSLKAPYVSTASHVRNLKTGSNERITESLGTLIERNDPSGVPDALPLLQSRDDYVWLNAAIYTGKHGRAEAIPYLIKGLHHTASQADPEILDALKKLTGEDFRYNFFSWQAWWIVQNPGTHFDWYSSLGPFPRVPSTQRDEIQN